MSAIETQGLVEKRVAQFVAVRDQLREMKEAYEAKCKPLEEVKNLLSGWMLDHLEKSGAQSIKTAQGTCYSSSKSTASLADPKAFMDYVVEHGAFELLDRRANSKAVKAFIEENKQLPPGCNFHTIKTVGVRRPGEKAGDE